MKERHKPDAGKVLQPRSCGGGSFLPGGE